MTDRDKTFIVGFFFIVICAVAIFAGLGIHETRTQADRVIERCTEAR